MVRTAKLTLDEAVALVALNDEPTLMDVREVAGLVSVGLIADVYGLTALGLARKIVAYRRAHEVA